VRLSSEVIGVSRLAATDRAAMLELMQRHYENVLPDRFFYDLERKTSVILVREPEQGALCGFSTQAVVEIGDESGVESLAAIGTKNPVGEPGRRVPAIRSSIGATGAIRRSARPGVVLPSNSSKTIPTPRATGF